MANDKPFEFEDITDSLNDRQKLFCMYYVGESKFNATESAKKAGYSENTANEQGARLLVNVSIQNYIESLKKDLGLRIGVTAEMIAQEYAKIGFSNMVNMLNENNGVKSVQNMPLDVSATIKKVKVKQTYDIEGNPNGEMVEIEAIDKISALDKLARMIGVDGVSKVAQTDTEGKDAKIKVIGIQYIE